MVFFRDNVVGEELELFKFLNEFGIKEFYVWDNRREIFRKLLFGNDEIDKEKKKFLGFFKVNKRSNSKGCLIIFNFLFMYFCFFMLGLFFLLGSILGVFVKLEMKKC